VHVVGVRRLCALILFAPAGLAACSGAGDQALGPTAVAERGRLERIVVATGTIEPDREVEVRPRIPGIIEKIHVHDGDRVELDAPLLELERDLLEAQVREAEATLADAQVELHYAKIALDRSQELERGGAASQQKHDDARSRHERAVAGVARARAQLDTLATHLSYATVRSPLAGRVLRVHVEEGSAVSPVTAVTGGTLLLSLAGTDALHLEGLVDENEVARVAVGQEARVRTEAFPDRRFAGVVREIAPLGERVQNVTYFEVEIDIVDDEAGLLRARMSGDADIVSEVIENAVFVPETALRYNGDQIYVERVVRESDAVTSPVAIQIGVVDGSKVQVLSGIEEGDEVTLK
jgi:HlyD family secretion protein